MRTISSAPAGTGALLLAITMPIGIASAADLGGSCCADLEERIAELESSVARKGNRKVTLTVYGQASKSLLVWDDDPIHWKGSYKINGVGGSASGKFGGSDGQSITDNSNEPTFVGFMGSAKATQSVTIGYVLEVGLGGYVADGAKGSDTQDVYLRKSYVYARSNTLGSLTLGHASQATDDMDKLTPVNVSVARTPLSLRPLTGPEAGDAADIFDGNRASLIRWDSPAWSGIVLSASWAPGNDDDEAGDVAIRYAGEFDAFKVMGGAGFRQGVVINGGGATTVVAEDVVDLETWNVTGTVLHVPTGLFIGGTYAAGDGSLFDGLTSLFGVNPIDLDTEGWQATGGIEAKWIALGRTTLYGEYGEMDVEAKWRETFGPVSVSITGEAEVTYWGAGVVQAVDNAAMDLFATIRQYEVEAGIAGSASGPGFDASGSLGASQDSTVGTVGARIEF